MAECFGHQRAACCSGEEALQIRPTGPTSQRMVISTSLSSSSWCRSRHAHLAYFGTTIKLELELSKPWQDLRVAPNQVRLASDLQSQISPRLSGFALLAGGIIISYHLLKPLAPTASTTTRCRRPSAPLNLKAAPMEYCSTACTQTKTLGSFHSPCRASTRLPQADLSQIKKARRACFWLFRHWAFFKTASLRIS